MSSTMLYEEIHSLATAYHWSEGEILALPRRKRRHYLSLVARDRENSWRGEGRP